MSHIVQIQTEVRDLEALTAACRRLQLKPPEDRVTRFYDGSDVKGYAVELRDWSYPVVFDLRGGVRFDNYEGRWGHERELHGLMQIYAVEKTKIEARKLGHSVTERLLDDGRIRLSVIPPQEEVLRT